MTDLENARRPKIPDGPAPGGESDPRASRRRLVWAAVFVVILGFWAWVVSQLSAGVEGTPRANPDPVQLPYGAAPGRAHPPFLGITDLAQYIELAFYVVMVVILAPLLWISWRQRRLHELVVLYLAVTAIAVFDPIANWSTYTIYDPRLVHYPIDWWWAAWSPTTEPFVTLPGYGAWLVAIALIAAWVNRRFFVPRFKPNSWFARHPMIMLFGVGYLLGGLWDIAIELVMMRSEFYYYSQTWGPAIHWDFVTLPLTEIHWMSTIAAFTTVMLWRDDRGDLVFARVQRRLRILPGMPVLGSLLVGVVLMWSSYAICNIGWASIRLFNLADNVYTQPWRYSELKVYDPQGVLQEQGHPGPFYDDGVLGVGLSGRDSGQGAP